MGSARRAREKKKETSQGGDAFGRAVVLNRKYGGTRHRDKRFLLKEEKKSRGAVLEAGSMSPTPTSPMEKGEEHNPLETPAYER